MKVPPFVVLKKKQIMVQEVIKVTPRLNYMKGFCFLTCGSVKRKAKDLYFFSHKASFFLQFLSVKLDLMKSTIFKELSVYVEWLVKG